MIARALSALSLAFALAFPARADVRLVAPSGAPFTTIQAAVDAANDGDVVLVRPGDYAAFVVTDKAVTVAASSAGSVRVLGASRVQSLAATRGVVLSGLRFEHTGGALDPSLRLLSNSGAVRIQQCDFTGALLSPRSYGAWITSSLDVAVVSSTFTGGHGNGAGGYGRPGLFCEGSRVALYDCTLHGGQGAASVPSPTNPYVYGGDGGAGWDSINTLFHFASGSSCTGGPGGIGYGGGGGYGGDGVRRLVAPGVLKVLQVTATGGSGGPGGSPPSIDGVPYDPPPTLTYPGLARHMTVAPVLHEQSTVTLTFEGQPGDDVTLFASQGTRFDPQDALRGVLLIRARQPPVRAVPVGMIPGSGVLTFSYPIGDLGPGVEEFTYHFQATFRDPSSTTTLGPPRTITFVDSAF